MRKDVYERMRQMKKEGIKPNYAEISRMMNCDWRTAKKQYETLDVDKEYQRPPKPSKLDPYKEIIREKVEEWEKAEIIDDIMEHSVRTYVAGANRMENHPSYQAYAYSVFIKNSSEQVQDEDIGIIPCAYLHNYDPKYVDALKKDIYKMWYEEAPFFIKNQVLDLRNFIKKYISMKSSDDDLLSVIILFLKKFFLKR